MRDDRGADDRLVDAVNFSFDSSLAASYAIGSAGEVARVGHPDFLAGVHEHAVDGVRRGGDQRQVEFPLEPLAHDLHVQQAEEPAAEPEPERVARLRLVDQRGVVQPQLVQRVAQFRVIVPVHRVQAGEHHRPGVVVAGQRLGRGMARAGHGVAHPGLAHVLHAGDQVTDLASGQAVGRDRLR
jgi:hypothetical protein